MYWKSTYEQKRDKYRQISGLLISRVVFCDPEELDGALAPVLRRANKLLNNSFFRKIFTDEILSAKKNISGTGAENLKVLYRQLKMNEYALVNMQKKRWHIQAGAIQELTLMEMDEFQEEIYPFTNHAVELIRMEAQSALVQFKGFAGLDFLDDVIYSISEWQQIKLLQKLASAPQVNLNIEHWLQSENNSVVLFALKLARSYHRFELHDFVISCLDHESTLVRQQAILCFCEIYNDHTSIHLISRFWRENLATQLMIIKALQNIGSENDHQFLLTLLKNENYDMRLMAARALASGGIEGQAALKEYQAQNDHLEGIIKQVKAEQAA
jgi:HEAT repeat protein